jgi:hypothetical protein
MRPKIAMWSDYRSPTQRRWKSPYRRSARSSIGLKILVVAVVFVAGIIAVSGIYPQIIDSEWVQNARPHAKRTVAEATTTRGSGPVTAIPLSPRRDATTTGEAAASAPRAAPPAPAVAEPPKAQSSVAAVEMPPSEAALPPADIPDAQAVTDSPVTPAVGAAPVVRPAQRYVARAPVVVKKHVVRTAHHRSSSGAYAQYGGGWGGGWGGGSSWGGWPGLGSPYHF